MVNIEIRPIRNRAELEECYDLWGNVFAENESRSFFQERLDYDESYHYDTTWIAKVDGEIASSVQIFPYDTRFGNTVLRVGGIGNVATKPEFRGKGLAKEILHAQIHWMGSYGFNLSLLFTGIYSFYHQMGWRQIPERMFRFDREMGGGMNGALGQKRANVKSGLDNGKNGIVPANLPQDLEGLIHVYEAWNHKQGNSMARTEQYWQNQIKWKHESASNFLIKRENESIVAYIRLRHRDSNTEILEACYLNGKEDDMVHVFLHLLGHPDCRKSVTMRIPENHVLADVLRKAGVIPIAFNSAMWRFFDFTRLMNQIEPVLQERVFTHPEIVKGKAILFRCENDCVILDFNKTGEFSVQPYSGLPRYDMSIELTDAQFLGLLTQGIQILGNHKLSQNPYLKLLFPNQSGILWTSDFF